MTLTDEQIKEFQMIYEAHGGPPLSRDESIAIASALIDLVRALYELD